MTKKKKAIKITITDKVAKEYVKNMVIKYRNTFKQDDETYHKLREDLEVLHTSGHLTYGEYTILCDLFLWEIL